MRQMCNVIVELMTSCVSSVSHFVCVLHLFSLFFLYGSFQSVQLKRQKIIFYFIDMKSHCSNAYHKMKGVNKIEIVNEWQMYNNKKFDNTTIL